MTLDFFRNKYSGLSGVPLHEALHEAFRGIVQIYTPDNCNIPETTIHPLIEKSGIPVVQLSLIHEEKDFVERHDTTEAKLLNNLVDAFTDACIVTIINENGLMITVPQGDAFKLFNMHNQLKETWSFTR